MPLGRWVIGGLMMWLAGCAGGALAEVRQLTTDGRLKDSPTFIDATGQELVYVVQETPQLMRAMRLSLADGTINSLNPEWSKNEFEPAFARDGSWLATVQSRGNLSMALVMRPFPRGKEVELPPEGGFCGFRSPTFTPDGKQIYYSFADRDRQAIMAVNREGGDKRTIIDGPGHANWPTFSPDGKQLAFASTRHGNYEIYVAPPDGTAPQRLTDHPRQDIRPRFSPDGKRIVFTSGRDGNYEIYVMAADGTNLRRLTQQPERDDYACWHPDSRHLVYVSERAGRYDLYLLDADAGP